jgi:hypothetical protein
MIEDRRTRRSEVPHQALTMFLSACRTRLGAHALAVATGGGRLVAGSGDGALLVAVVGARVAAGGSSPCDVAVSRVRVGPDRYVVAALGNALDPDVAAGVQRILARDVH